MKFKIWQRYFLKQVSLTFFFLLLSFYLLFVLIDYSSNSRNFAHADLPLATFFTYYLCQFSKQLHLLVPFALLVSVIRCLTSMNSQNELTALLVGGSTRKELMRPFLLVGFICTLFLYANVEWVLPGSLNYLKNLNERYFRHSDKKNSQVHSLALRDHSVLLYQSWDAINERFFDLYWVRSADDVYRIKYLYPEDHQSLGQYVDHLQRNEEGKLERVEIFHNKIFPELGFSDDVMGSAILDPSSLSISHLWTLRPADRFNMTDREALFLSALHSKLALPWLCLLVVIAPAPFCLLFTRHLPVFAIFSFALAGFVIFLTFFDAMLILGEGLVLPPLVAAWSPFLPVYGYFTYKYIRMK